MHSKKRYFSPIVLKFFFAFSILLVLSTLLLMLFFSHIGQQNIIQQAQQRISNLIFLSEEQLSQKLTRLENQMLMLMVNNNLNDAMVKFHQEGKKIYHQIASDVWAQLSYVFSSSIGNGSVHLFLDDAVFSYQQTYNNIFFQRIQKSEIWEQIQKANGSVAWFPPDFQHQWSKTLNGQSSFFLLGRVMNMTDLKHMKMSFFKEEKKPVLLLCLDPEFFSEAMTKNLDIKKAQYTLLDCNGNLFSNDQKTKELLGDIKNKIAGETGYITNRKIMCFYQRSKATGWYHVIFFHQSELTQGITRQMKKMIVRTCIPTLCLMFGLGVWFARSFSKPVNALVKAVHAIENGEFGYEVTVKGHNELSYLTEQFNHMSRVIQHLIEENYQVRLREKETEIMSLTIQFNPHYLYNTLNSIFWVANQEGARETARMLRELSRMMRYTSDHKRELTKLKDDLEWMYADLDLLEARYGTLFCVEWNIDSSLENCMVPKLFLQPLIENCIVHGFKDIEKNGKIFISGTADSENCFFKVQDNGSGMSPELVKACNAEEPPYLGIANVQKRIRLMYGPNYGLFFQSIPKEGTTVMIKIPKKSNKK